MTVKSTIYDFTKEIIGRSFLSIIEDYYDTKMKWSA